MAKFEEEDVIHLKSDQEQKNPIFITSVKSKDGKTTYEGVSFENSGKKIEHVFENDKSYVLRDNQKQQSQTKSEMLAKMRELQKDYKL